MKFEEALSAVRQGKRVRRSGWMPGCSVGEYAGRIDVEGDIQILNKHILADDWEVIPPPAPKLYPFSVALEMARVDENVRIRRKEWSGGRWGYAFLDGEFGAYGSGASGGWHTGLAIPVQDIEARDWVIEVVNG